MTMQSLAFIAQKLNAEGVEYSFGQWNKKTVYPYFVGDYIESSTNKYDNMTVSKFMLTGTSDTDRLSLENVKKKVKTLFPLYGFTHIFPDGSGIAIMYSDSFFIPDNTGKFYRIQINLTVKEWSVK